MSRSTDRCSRYRSRSCHATQRGCRPDPRALAVDALGAAEVAAEAAVVQVGLRIDAGGAARRLPLGAGDARPARANPAGTRGAAAPAGAGVVLEVAADAVAVAPPRRAVGRLAGAFGEAGAVAQDPAGRALARRGAAGAAEAVAAEVRERVLAGAAAADLPVRARAPARRLRRTFAAHARLAGGAGGAAGAAVQGIGLQIDACDGDGSSPFWLGSVPRCTGARGRRADPPLLTQAAALLADQARAAGAAGAAVQRRGAQIATLLHIGAIRLPARARWGLAPCSPSSPWPASARRARAAAPVAPRPVLPARPAVRVLPPAAVRTPPPPPPCSGSRRCCLARQSGHFAPLRWRASRRDRRSADPVTTPSMAPWQRRDLLLADPHRHQRLLRSQRDAQLQAVAGGFAHHRQAGAIGQRQRGVVQAALRGRGEAEVAPHLAGARRPGSAVAACWVPAAPGRRRPPRRCRPGRPGLRDGAGEPERAEQPASSGATERGTAGPGSTQRTSQGIEAIRPRSSSCHTG